MRPTRASAWVAARSVFVAVDTIGPGYRRSCAVASPHGREHAHHLQEGRWRAAGCGRSPRRAPTRSSPRSARWHVRQGSVDEVGEDGFDDRVPAMGDIGVGGRGSGVGEERMMPPHREQRVGVAGVFDAAHDQPGGNRSRGGSKSGVGGFGDLGIFRSTLRCPGRGPLRGTSPGSTPRRRWSRSRTGPRCSCPGPARSTLSRAGTPR